jgi:hypothetical protein
MEGASCINTNFSHAVLSKANLTGAVLRDANLEQAILEQAILEWADLTRANLKKANLGRAVLDNAVLVAADLKEGILRQTNLKQAVLQNANLSKADLTEADLSFADLRGANAEGGILEDVQYNRRGRYKGIRLDASTGNPRFKRFALHQAFLEQLRGNWLTFPLYACWLVLTDCGRSFFLWALWSVAFILGFGFKYFSMGHEAFQLFGFSWDLSTALSSSAKTFASFVFGSIDPRTAEAAKWVMGEVIAGYIMLAGLISIFVTKFWRRKR